ncbi:CDC45-like protein [Gloeophyllum trabeum ATCC 11539]|uniref:CDC45-like protein n=1 Tax=Gloeophyllum trabeum (strain ATCC 11539 / FP-39264 / Madison 617) TaxID=670483 RepID=S7RUG0_GLOTA|nr:CDC45-like protein [Gloeophyllum trabeum ATCC 11539]EPQ58375.1 CDC45-like protein [Gloeophyllum trabeum ATCC 11539]
MVFIPPPHLASASRPSYGEAYANILAAHRRSPLTSASSVIMLVAPDVDALCAARMLANLFKQDDVMHRIIPVSGIAELERMREELMTYSDLHTLILVNMGAILDLPSPAWFGEFSTKLSVHVIDSTRPQNLSSLFLGGENGERIIVWDDGGTEKLEDERKAWEALMYEPEPDSDEEDSDLESDDVSEDEEEDVDHDDEESNPSGKRKSGGEGGPRRRKRRRNDDERPLRMSRADRERYSSIVNKHYTLGTWHGQSASGTIYILATVLERVDNDLLWLAILGLTHQYNTTRISREDYEKYHSIYYDEVFRLNPPLPADASSRLKSLHPDDQSVRATEELRFMLFRHWTLYDAMYHSSYVASKLGIWKERGRKRLTGLLAKMGFSIPQTQQPYSHMDMDLKKHLRTKLEAIAPEYGLVELSYPSFMRCYGYRSQPLSAADAVEATSALLDVAGGVRMEVEVEGTRNGGEWFGGGRVWDIQERWREEERENVPPGGIMKRGRGKEDQPNDDEDGEHQGEKLQWWVKNFWSAYDALSDINKLQSALPLSMSLHRAIIRQGSSIIDKQDIKTMRNHRVVVLTQGPDLALFSHPGVLSRLALWLVDALRDRVNGQSLTGRKSKRKSLPFVVACLNEKAGSYVVVGVTGAMDFGDVRKNEFGLAFLDAKERCNARTRHGSFDTSVIEINQADIKIFLETLAEGPDY